MAEWYQDEAFWVEFYPHMFPEERFSAAADQVAKALALADFQEGPVLDLCCGPGRHAVELASRGLAVTAVDATPFLLNQARQRAAELSQPVEFVLSDMRDFVRPEAFALALNMFTSFGYFEDEGDDLRVLRNLCESLQPGGAFLIDVMGKEILAKRFQPTLSAAGPDGSVVVERLEIIDDWGRVSNQWTLIKGETARSFTFRLRVYSGQELKGLMKQAGFADVKLFGDLDGGAYGVDAARLIAVGRKGD